MNETPITEMQAIEILRNIMNQIPHHKVYFTMKELKLRRIRTETVDMMRACLAIHHSGLPITTELISILLGKTRGYLAGSLHGLGDKQCLTLKRGESSKGRGDPCQWLINPLFIKYYNGEKDEP